MPKAFSYAPLKTAKANIEAAQKILKSKSFDDPEQYNDESKKSLFTSIFAARMSANAVRGKKKSLKVTAEESVYQENVKLLSESKCFDAFLKEKGSDEIKRLLTEGHGGAAEDAFQSYVLDQATLPQDVPERYMPTAKNRIEAQQKKLLGLEPSSDEAAAIYADIFRCRRTVNAVRNKGGSLEVKLDGKELAKQPSLKENSCFNRFVSEQGVALKQAVGTGHGGAAEDLFQNYILEMTHIPADAPAYYMPTADKRTEALQKKLRGSDDPSLYTELMATREAVEAVRGQKSSLEKTIDPAALSTACTKWEQCKSFQEFLSAKPREAAEAAAAGHGGKLQDAYKDYVLHLDHIPEGVPEGYMPTGLKRVEAIQAKFRSPDYILDYSSEEDRLKLAAELMATREAVEAVRGKENSLDKPLDYKKLQTAYTKWSSCKAFQEYVRDPEHTASLRAAASAGHGGALEDRFKEYLLTRPILEADIPEGYMPTGLPRVEALQKMLREGKGDQKQILTELIATRNTVDAVRGKKDSLKKDISPSRLKAEREQLLKCQSFQDFLGDEAKADQIRTAALAGHGGALEDLFKDHVLSMNHIPADVPIGVSPNALKRTEALKKKISAEGSKATQDMDLLTELSAELLATRRSVGAVRGKKDSLETAMDSKLLESNYQALTKSECFRDYIRNNRIQAVAAATAGHGGALEDRFREHVAGLKALPEEVPSFFIPNAQERIEGIQKQLKKQPQPSEEDRVAYCAQILAARQNVNAIRKDKKSLAGKPDPAAVNKAANTLANCDTFKKYIADHAAEAIHAATSGHGGELDDKFKEYVRGADTLAADLPDAYAPTALERTEALQKKIGSDDFARKTPQEKAALYAELLGARRAVGSIRGKEDSLKIKIPAATAAKEAQKLKDCQTFQDFVANNPDLVKSAARSGHGGKLEDKFKEYVLNLDHIPQDVPTEYMPTAVKRAEVLQKKIDASTFREKSKFDQNQLYRELAATRAAVNSIRHQKNTLDITVDAAKLNEARQGLNKGGPDDFFDHADREKLKKAAGSGHGGAMDDMLRDHIIQKTVQDGALPDVPKRWMPTNIQLRDALKKNLAQELKTPLNPNLAQNKEITMKKVASMMFLTKLEKEGGKLDPTEMQRSVDALMNSQSFKNMFAQENATRQVTQLVTQGRMYEVFQRFATQGGNPQQIRQQPAPQIQAQHQPIQNNLNPPEAQNQQGQEQLVNQL